MVACLSRMFEVVDSIPSWISRTTVILLSSASAPCSQLKVQEERRVGFKSEDMCSSNGNLLTVNLLAYTINVTFNESVNEANVGYT